MNLIFFVTAKLIQQCLQQFQAVLSSDRHIGDRLKYYALLRRRAREGPQLMLTFENASYRRLRNVVRLKHNAVKVGDSETMFPLRRLISKILRRLSLQKRTNQNFIKNRFCLNFLRMYKNVYTSKNFNRFFKFLFFSRDFTMYVSITEQVKMSAIFQGWVVAK